MTHQEWTFYWKSKYESTLQKVVLSQQFFEKSKAQMNSMFQEISHLRKANEDLAAQLKTLQEQRQVDAAKEGGAPEAAVVKPFKRGKKKG
jgi:chromosome segregation ATPase